MSKENVEAGGIDFVSLLDTHGVIHHITSRADSVKEAVDNMAGLVNELIIGQEWEVHNDVRETLPYGNKTRQNEVVSHNPEPERVKLDENGNEVYPDSAGNTPGMTGYFHITKAKFGMVKDGKVEYTLNGPYKDTGNLAKWPYWDRKNAKVEMVIGWFKNVIPDLSPEWFNSARVPEMDVNWRVEYEVSSARPKYTDSETKEEKLGKYYLNIAKVTEMVE